MEPEERRGWTAELEDAARQVRGRIRADAALFPDDEEIAALLEHLAAHLFDFELDVNRWLQASGCSRGTRDRFISRLGPLKAYLDGRRIAVAVEVLRKTSEPIGKIGRRVGFTSPRTFQRTFERVIGMRPSELREAAAAEPEETMSAMPGTAPDASDPEHGQRLLAVYWRRQVTLGLLDGERRVELRRLLRRLYEVLRQRRGRRRRLYRRRDLSARRNLAAPFPAGDELKLRDRAFRLTDAAIEHDAQRRWQLSDLFYAIHKHLFEPAADLERIREAAGCPRSLLQRRFVDLVGQTPWSYVREARLETAARLLVLTPLKIVDVSRLVGYASRSTFHRQFAEFAGLGPTEYRRRARPMLWPWRRPPCSDNMAPYYWESAVSGQLAVSEVLELDGYLGSIEYPT